MAVNFDFEKTGKCFFGDVFRPVAKVSFMSPSKKDNWSDIWMIVDTGADFTILPKYVSQDLGISLENDCILDTTVGVGGEQKIHLFRGKIKTKIGNLERKVPIAFFDSDEVPPLLGRLGFLETFEATFSKNHKLVLK